MRNESEVPEKLKQFLVEAKTTGNIVNVMLCDNGGEFGSGIMRTILQEHGIKQRLKMPKAPKQNGCSERDNWTFVKTARGMMRAHEWISDRLWAEMVNTAAYMLNRTGPSSIRGMAHIEVWTSKKP